MYKRQHWKALTSKYVFNDVHPDYVAAMHCPRSPQYKRAVEALPAEIVLEAIRTSRESPLPPPEIRGFLCRQTWTSRSPCTSCTDTPACTNCTNSAKGNRGLVLDTRPNRSGQGVPDVLHAMLALTIEDILFGRRWGVGTTPARGERGEVCTMQRILQLLKIAFDCSHRS